jgi:hypothetical protein
LLIFFFQNSSVIFQFFNILLRVTLLGGCNYEAGCKYLSDLFISLVKEKKQVFAHVTCATDTQNVKLVFNSVRHSLLQKQMVNLGIDVL